MKTKQSERDPKAAHDLRFTAALRDAPKFQGVETLMPVALELRRVWARFYPHMKEIFTNHYPI